MASYPRIKDSSAGRALHNPYTVFRRAFDTNATTSTMEMSVPTLTAPSTATAGVHTLEKGNSVIVKPYGTDTDADEFRLGIQVWHPMHERSSDAVVWIPTILALYDCTIDSSTVAASTVGPLVVGDMFCDIIIQATGTTQKIYDGAIPSNKSADYIPSNDVPTKFSMMTSRLDTLGAKYIQFFVDIDGGGGTAAASGNALFAVV